MNEDRHTLPPELQKKAVDHLHETLAPESLQYLRDLKARDPEWGDELTPEQHEESKTKYGFTIPAPFHFGTGMAIRNLLREVIKDEELPVVYYGAMEARNWDDWYHGVLEELVTLSDDSNGGS